MKRTMPRRGWLIPVSLIFLMSFAGILYLSRRSGLLEGVLNQGSRAGSGFEIPVKLIVDRDGMCEVDLKELPVDQKTLNAAINDGLELLNQGRPENFWVDGKSGKLYFYGKKFESLYSKNNVYWLGKTGSLKPVFANEINQVDSLQQSSNSIAKSLLEKLPAGTYPETYLAEENLIYNPLAEQGDGWFWETLRAPITKEIPIQIDHLDQNGPAHLRINLWASTEAPASPDHHLLVSVNGEPVTDQKWDGKGWQLVEAEIPAGVLREGTNQIQISLPGDMNVLADIVLLDWVELIYPRQFQAIDDRLNFLSPGGQVKLSGFSGPVDIYDVTNPDMVSRIGEAVNPKDGFSSEMGHEYAVTGHQGYLKPAEMEIAELAPDLRSAENAADYIVVGPSTLLQSVQPLLNLREKDGLQSMAVPVEAIYDQFNQGIPDPQAIRNFLSSAQKQWKVPPKYLLLVGDASYDPKGYQTPLEANQLPTFFVNTIEGGQTASDYGFSVPGGSNWQSAGSINENMPSLAVGRIPARTISEVTDYVNKVISYEKSLSQPDAQNPWQKRILAVADGSESSFKTDAENFLSHVPEGYQTQLMAPEDGQQDFNQSVIHDFNQGNWLVIYFGHGSLNMWGKDQLLTISDISNIKDSAYLPVVINLTCLTGYFIHPKQESLAEAFLWQPNGGAVAVLAPTSLTLAEDQSYLSYALADEMITKKTSRIGEILLNAQQQVLIKNPNRQDVLRTFLLFGDPALPVSSTGSKKIP